MSMLLPEPTVTAPQFAANPARWAVWYLKNNGHIYRAFRHEVLTMLRARPGIRLSADQVLHVIRWNSILAAEGDFVAINNNLSSLFARLLIEEHPEHEGVFTRRHSVWDDLTLLEWDDILLEFERLRHDRRRR